MFFDEGFVAKLIQAAARSPEAPAIEMLDAPHKETALWTYGEIAAHAERYRWVFQWLDVGPGDFVLVQLASGPDFVACMYALVSIGAVFTSVSPQLTAHELEVILADLKPAGVVVSSAGAANVASAKPDTRFVLFTDGAPAGFAMEGPVRVFGLAEIPAGTSRLEEPSGNPIATCQYTYKGLGYPLGVLHRYHDYTWCTAGIMNRYGKPERVRHLVGLPLYATFGLSVQLIAPMCLTGHLMITSSLFEINVVDVLARYQIYSTCIVPLLAKRLALSTRRKKRNFQFHPNLRLVSGGSYMSPELVRELTDALGVECFQGYGMTETLPVTGTFPGRNVPGSIGIPLLDQFEIKVIDVDGAEVAAGVAGQIAYRGPTLMKGFLGKPELNERYQRDGWFLTGDVGYKDHDGFLYYLGRSFAFTKVAGQMVDLLEVERVLERYPGVTRARITAHQRPGIGETLMASVIAAGDAEIAESALRQWCLRFLSNYKCPREFRIVNG
jgi:long-chain acyl-CoA synthetase